MIYMKILKKGGVGSREKGQEETKSMLNIYRTDRK
jgi:hypothetical protein